MRIVEWAPAVMPDRLPPFGDDFEAHFAEMRHPARRVESAAAWALLYRILQTYGLPVGTVVFGEYGKPAFREDCIFFSLSHADGAVAVSVADVPTGVDIERVDRRFSPRMPDKCLTEREAENYDGDFIRLWCRKESIVKLTGEGLYGYPDHIETGDSSYSYYETRPVSDGIVYQLTAVFLKEKINNYNK